MEVVKFMENVNKIDLLVRVAKLYYEHNYSQQMIAEELGFSRPYISKLINEAREVGIVEVKINDPKGAETKLERETREKFGLKKVIVIPRYGNSNANLLEKLSMATSNYLNTIIQDGDIIGVSWGATLYSCSLNLHPIEEVDNISVVQLCGAVSMTEKNIYATEIPKNFAIAYGGTPYFLPLPAVVDNVEAKEAIVKDKNIDSVLKLGQRSNIAIFSIGPFGHNSTLPRAGYITPEEVDMLLAKGAVGDMFSRVIDINGNICDRDIDERTIGIELQDIVKKEYRIGVAGGVRKARSIYAMLIGGYPNVLITDEETCLEVLKIYEFNNI